MKEGLFMEQKYLRMEDQKFGLVRKQHVAKGRRLEPKVNVVKILYVLNFIVEARDEESGGRAKAMGNFLNIFVVLGKKQLF